MKAVRLSETTWEERGCLAYSITRSLVNIEGICGRNSSRNHGGELLAGLLRLMICWLSMQLRATCPKNSALPAVGWTLLHQLTIKTIPHSPTWYRHPSAEDPCRLFGVVTRWCLKPAITSPLPDAACWFIPAALSVFLPNRTTFYS